MCGIAGVIQTNRFGATDVANMIDCIKYRGPDEQDVVAVGPCLLGHARLAVVDPENGSQPMSNTDNTVWVVFNGEIYNFIELREGLKAKGYQFKSRCDTEVLVHLWREKGARMLEDLIGMYAFCLWDIQENKGIIARDRQGIKPCYLMDVDGGVAFASEIKSLLSLPNVDTTIDDIGLNLMHVFNYCPPPRTCFKGISHLEPGHYIEINGDGSRTKKKYWSWPIAAEKTFVNEDEFSALLDDAIRMQMRFDVKGCLFLSGGVDSSVIAAHLREIWNEEKMLAFGLDCKLDGFGEFHLAEKVAKQLNIDLQPVRYDQSIVPENIDEVLKHTDQPHGDFSFFLIKKLCEEAHSAGVIVAFNGDGPDEILSGFSHNTAFFGRQTRTNFSLTDYFSQICFMPEKERALVLQPEFRQMLENPIELFEEVLTPYRHLEPIEQVAAYESSMLSPGNNLIKTDRMGAGNSIEGRSPFMDHRISEIFARMPVSQKFHDGRGKFFLKKFGLRYFDKDLMFRKKSMPTMPIGEWIKGPLNGWARERLSELDPSRYNVLGALRLLSQHSSGQFNHTQSLRTLLMSSVWLKNLNV